jgi:carboxylate-amine ligase
VLLAVHVRALVMTALDGPLDRASAHAPVRPVPARQRVLDLVRHVEPALRRMGELRVVRQLLSKVIGDGNGAVLARAAFRRRGRLADVVELARHTVAACRPSRVGVPVVDA